MGEFQKLPGVEDVHDLHIWSISSNSISLTCHIRVSYTAVICCDLLPAFLVF